jgi:hypothetical protein
MSKGSSKLKKAIDKIVNPTEKAKPEVEETKEVVAIEQPIQNTAHQATPDLGQKTMPGILALRKKFGK